MAKLHSEDQQFKSFFELIPGEVREDTGTEKWQVFSLKLSNGGKSLRFGDVPLEDEELQLEKRSHPTAVDGERIPLDDGSFLERHPQDNGAKGYIFCRAPKDEVAQLVALLKRLATRKSTSIRFETLEPSLELEITRQVGEALGYAGEAGYAGDESGPGAADSGEITQVEDDGLKVQLFVDAGNVETEISRWDALGIRFFTNQTNLEQFIETLQKEFDC